MDIETHILRLQHDIQENPAAFVLAIMVTLAVVFIALIYFDGYVRQRKKNKRKRG